MNHLAIRAGLALAAAAAGTVVAVHPASAAETAKGVIIANGGLRGHQRPSTHAPGGYTWPKGTKVTLDCQVPGTSVDGNARWYLVVAEGDNNWVSARYVRNVGPAPDPCDPSDGSFAGRTTTAVKKRVGPTTADASAGSYAANQRLRVRCYTGHAQKWYLTDQDRWVRATYVATSKNVRYCTNV